MINARRMIHRVLTPLGQQAAALLEDLSSFHDAWSNQRSFVTTADIYHSDYKVTPATLQAFAEKESLHNPEAWEGLHQFLEDEYFSRFWSIQDTVWSKTLVIRTPSLEISWDVLCLAIEAAILLSYGKSLPPAAANILASGYFRRHPNKPSGFHDWLIAEQSTMSLIPNDRMAVPMPIFEDCEHGRVSVWPAWDMENNDSGLSIFETFARAALVIGHVRFSLTTCIPQAAHKLPSWVPDWRYGQTRLLLNHPKSSFGASLLPDTFVIPDLNDGLTVELKISGYQVDIVVETSCYLPPRRHCDHYDVYGADILHFDEWFAFVKGIVGRQRRSEPAETDEFLLQFMDTVQARGCNTIWEHSMPVDRASRIERARQFVDFFDCEDMNITPELRLFHAACFPAHGRRIGVTRKGRLGLFPEVTERGDIVAILDGCKVPIILRKIAGEDERFKNIGESYVNGLMMGEMDSQTDCERKVFTII
ncbi:heterokaryon incompatibility protein-domain-containing protein [Apiospora marii]|uniref:Heterokaryon incompatibility protein-domain-containing protein n=1 Tax=Apiospora marii TaxID=335849 RepID=A0ABR1R099_9PEZI